MKKFACWALLAVAGFSVFAEIADAALRGRRGRAVNVLVVRGGCR